MSASHPGGGRQARRSPRAGLAALTVVAAFGATLLSLADGSGLRTAVPDPPISIPPLVDTTLPTTTTEPLPGDAWTLLPEGPLEARSGQSVAWTGTEMIVWGGGLGGGAVFDDGAAYDPAADAWRSLPAPPAGFGPRLWHTAVWTGTEMILWGGYPEGGGDDEGAGYDPSRDAWRPVAPAGGPHRWLHTAVWTGTEMIVWGGEQPGTTGPELPGLAYDPAADRWRRIAEAPIASRRLHTAVWTGAEMIVWGGADGNGTYLGDGAAYDPAADAWTVLPAAPLAPRARHGMVWDGTTAVVWGGRLGAAGPLSADGARYDPAQAEWQALPATALEPRESPVMVAFDGGVLAWSGKRRSTLARPPGARTGSVLAGQDRSWRQIRSSPFEGGGDFTGVWTGDELLVWGHPRAGPPVGARYRP